jgi:hypothetical protein
MSDTTLEEIQNRYSLPRKSADKIARSRQSAMVRGLQHAQDGYVRTVAMAAKAAKTTDAAQARSAMQSKGSFVGPQSMLAGPAETGGQDHAVSRDLTEIAFYPEHNARKESSAYAKVHHELVVVQDLPCRMVRRTEQHP